MDLPEYNVTRWPFNECIPCTVEGIRTLAYIALQTEMWDVLGYIDALELAMLQAKRIKPEGVGYDRDNRCKPIELQHVRRRRGRELVVRWKMDNHLECDACMGKGRISADGMNGKSYKVECPECDGSGEVDGDEEFILTDIDGNLRQAA